MNGLSPGYGDSGEGGGGGGEVVVRSIPSAYFTLFLKGWYAKFHLLII